MSRQTAGTNWAIRVILILELGVSAAAAQRPREQDIFNGVYSAAQAERGNTAFSNNCAACHKADLSGESAPALKGDSFIRNWEAVSVNQLFVKIRDSMPANGPEMVTDSIKLDIVAYILQANGFPAGRAALPVDPEALESIEIKRKGVNEVPNFSVAQMVGCLTRTEGGTWTLTNASAPIATKEERSTPQALTAARAVPLGNAQYLLLSIVPFQPDAHEHHKMEARGLLYRAPGDNRLDLLSLQMVASSCSN